MSPRRTRSERGFALLLVFLLAASVALILYRQLPRVAFENEREKEQVLIDRGEQYKRAIQLFRTANARWPQSIEELEKFADKRYLRRRYKDPMTGKDEWRLIHTNGAFLTDSLVTKPPTADGKQTDQLAANNGASTTTGIPGAPGGTPGTPGAANGPEEVNAAVLQRPSDRALTPQPGFASPPADGDPNFVSRTFDPNAPIGMNQGQGQLPFQPGFNPQQPGFGQQQGNFNPDFPPITLTPGAGQTGNPQPNQVPRGQGESGFNPQFSPQFPGQQFPGQQFPGQQSLPGQAPGAFQQQQAPQPAQFRIDANGQFVPIQQNQNQPPGAAQPGGLPQFAPGQPTLPQNTQNPQNPVFPPNGFAPTNLTNQNIGGPGRGGQPLPQGTANPAINLINQLLTTPRQGPNAAPLPGGITPGQTGIAGVASTSKGASIKRYKDRGKYNEWEFVFEVQQQQLPGQPGVPGQPGQPGQPNNRTGQPGAPGTQNPGGQNPIFQMPQTTPQPRR